MLFCYPIEAVAENWLHDCIVEMVRSSLQNAVGQGNILAWPSCIPANYRTRIGRRRGLRERFDKFCEVANNLTQVERQLVVDALLAQNNIPTVFDGASECPRKVDLPAAIQQPAKDLFEFCFDLLSDFEVRDRQYRTMYLRMPAHVCPFCGIEPFDAPGMAREDLDHYLAVSVYPFAGINLRNLTPMGHKCNAAHKRAMDILRDEETGLRRRCADPYVGPIFSVSLLESIPFEGEIVNSVVLPKWKVDLLGADEEITTWDKVFNIRNRYKMNVLDAEFRGWMDAFAQWCQQEVGNLNDETGVVEALSRYLTAVVHEGLAERTFLKRAVFEMLKMNCTGMPVSERLVDWFISLVSSGQGATA